MANTLTISVTTQDLHDLQENKLWSPSKIFRSAMRLHRKLEAFGFYTIEEYAQKILEMQEKFKFLQDEILKREEKIDSLKNVLEEITVAQRRIRKTGKVDNRVEKSDGALESLSREFGEQPEELAWPRKPETKW